LVARPKNVRCTPVEIACSEHAHSVLKNGNKGAAVMRKIAIVAIALSATIGAASAFAQSEPAPQPPQAPAMQKAVEDTFSICGDRQDGSAALMVRVRNYLSIAHGQFRNDGANISRIGFRG
jgi:hypothetical protein